MNFGLVLFVEVDDELFVVEYFFVAGGVGVSGLAGREGLKDTLTELL